MTTARRPALGRGLAALLGPGVKLPSDATAQGQAAQEPARQRSVLTIPVDAIRPNRRQPRQDFDSESLGELAASIGQAGLVQPLIVREVASGYELVAGERRWRASKAAGLTSVPCILTEATDQQSLLMALIENVQRENLNPMDEAEAYSNLREEFGLSQEEIAERVGKSRVAVANSLRLLGLPREIQEDLRDGALSAGHARALLGVVDPARRLSLWREVKHLDLSVRETEERARAAGGGRPRQTSAFTGRPRGASRDPEVEALTKRLEARLGCRVSIHRRGPAAGRVVLHYGSHEEFERIMDHLGLPASQRL